MPCAMFKPVYLGLGSNVGNRKRNLNQAIDKLNAHESIEVGKISSFMNTKAVARFPQPDYLNAVVQIKTILTPRELLEFTQSVEKELGRTSKGTYDPRTLDIDILFYDKAIITEDDLVIPHPLMHERAFVLIPLREIAPHFVHPVLQQTVTDLAKQVAGY